MKLKTICMLFALCLGLSACSSNSNQANEEAKITQEIKSLDSLSQTMESNIVEIENSIEAVESAVNELEFN